MSNLIAKIAITTILAFSIGHSAFAQNGEITGQMKSKAVSTLAADQPKSHKTQTPAGKAVEDNTAKEQQDTAAQSAPADSLDLDMAEVPDSTMMPVESEGFHKTLKVKYIEGNAGFMSFVALVLVLGLAFCIERIIYLTLSEINAKSL